jgi:hypothetical protein
VTRDRTPRKSWTRADDTAYREATAKAAPAKGERDTILADMQGEIGVAIRRAFTRLDELEGPDVGPRR